MEDRPAATCVWSWFTPPWRHRGVVGLLFLAVFWTYHPAIRHPPREDQWSFLLETVHEDRFLPLLVQTYSFNRTREIGPGDYLLFRPVLFALLSAEKALFGPDYRCWQAFGIVLHCGVVWLFLRILLRLHHTYPCAATTSNRLRLILAYVLALFFAVNFAGTEMVMWCHIQGYMLFVLFVLGSLLLLLDELCGRPLPRLRPWRLAGGFLLLLLAAFTYETGAVYALCLGIVLALVCAARGQVGRGLLLLALFGSILALFRAVDGLDQRRHPDPTAEVTLMVVLEHAFTEPTTTNAVRYVLFTLVQPFFPSCPEWKFENRLYIPDPWTTPGAYWRLGPLLVISYVVVLAAGWLSLAQLGRMLFKRHWRAAAFFLLVPASLILLQLGIIVLGRMNLRSGDALSYNSYYSYTPFLALLLGLYFLWVRLPLLPTRSTTVALVLILGGLGVLSAYSARKVHALTARIKLAYRPLRSHMNCMRELIQRHRHDSHFGISFDPEFYYFLDFVHGLTELEILFCRFIDHEHPTHVICGKGLACIALEETEYCRQYGGPRYLELPTLVRPGTDFMIFRHQQRYFGFDYHEGRFRRAGDEYCYLLEGDSVEDVISQVPTVTQRRLTDKRIGRLIPANFAVNPLAKVYRGYALYQAGDRIHAIPAAEGPLVRARLVANRYSKWYCATSIDGVKRLIDEDSGRTED